jgi:hypothetical protein
MFKFEGTVRVQYNGVLHRNDNASVVICDKDKRGVWRPVGGGIQPANQRSIDAKISFAVNEYKDIAVL